MRYILDENNKPVACPDVDEWAAWYKNNDKHVAADKIGGIYIYTVFLSTNHGCNSDAPVLWETMIFGGEYDEAQARYTSHEDAIAGHKVAVDKVKSEQQSINQEG